MNGFVAGPHEPGLEHFTQWLEHQVRRSPDTRGGILGAILGTTWGLCGAAVGILAGALQIQNAWAFAPLFAGFVLTVAGVVWYVRERSEQDKAAAQLQTHGRGLLWKLQTARIRSQLRSELGPQAVQLLEDGAKSWVRARAAFSSPLWSTGRRQAHSEARNRAKQAMDAAMIRLTLLAGNGAYQESEAGPAHKMASDMSQMADEAQKLIERLGERSFVDSVETSKDLRDALGELRMLSQAEEELGSVRSE